MPTTSYYSVGGEILGERTDGGSRTNYGVDALGSVTSTMVGDAVQNRYAYKPYGEELSRSGAGADPSFRWVGSLGYRSTGRSRSEQYVRARHYDSQGGRWSTVDPLWPGEPQYGYVRCRPTSLSDRFGLSPQSERCCEKYNRLRRDPIAYALVMACLVKKLGAESAKAVQNILVNAIDKQCGHGSNIKVVEVPKGEKGPDCLGIHRCDKWGMRGSSFPNLPTRPDPNPLLCGLTPYNAQCPELGPPDGGCIVVLCQGNLESHEKYCSTLLHEMSHCSGFGHGSPLVPRPDAIKALQCCLCRAMTGASYNCNLDSCWVNGVDPYA